MQKQTQKYYKILQIFIAFDEYNNFRHFHLTIIAELFKERPLLRNSTLITFHLKVL